MGDGVNLSGVKPVTIKSAQSKSKISSSIEDKIIASEEMLRDKNLNRTCKVQIYFGGPSRYDGKCIRNYLSKKSYAQQKELLQKWSRNPYWGEWFDPKRNAPLLFPYGPSIYPVYSPDSYFPVDSRDSGFPADFEALRLHFQGGLIIEDQSKYPPELRDPWFTGQSNRLGYRSFELEVDTKLNRFKNPLVDLKLKVDHRMPLVPIFLQSLPQ